MLFRRLTPVLASILAAGCSSILGLDGGRREEEAAQAARDFQEQAMRDLVISASTSITTRNGVDYLSTSGLATNVGSKAIRASSMGPPWLIRVYAGPDRTGTPLWRTEDVGYAVQTLLRPFEIAPGATVRFETVPEEVDRVFGGKPAGTYYVAVALTLWEPRVTTGSWPAGDITR